MKTLAAEQLPFQALVEATAFGVLEDVKTPTYEAVRKLMAEIAAQREANGLTSFEAAAFICFKDSWVPFLQAEYHNQPDILNREVVVICKLDDSLAL